MTNILVTENFAQIFDVVDAACLQLDKKYEATGFLLFISTTE